MNVLLYNSVRRLSARTLAITVMMLAPTVAYAHVKWFAQFNLSDQPATLDIILTPLFFALVVLSVVVIGLISVAGPKMEGSGWYQRLDNALAERAVHSLLVLRVAAFATLLLNWQADSMLAPELTADVWVGWFQFLIAFLLLFPRTVPLAGIGILILYFMAAIQFGFFHLLDYVHYAGVAWFFIVGNSSNERLRETRIPALYLTVGFALCWLALEKLVYPQWTAYLLQQNPTLTLGFDADFFRVGAAFVEFALGYLLIICLFHRPLAVVITLVFFLTTLVFGKVEVIGHTLIHGALIVFLLEGPGKFYRPPVAIHDKTWLRLAFVAVNYVLLLTIIFVAYYNIAWWMYGHAH